MIARNTTASFASFSPAPATQAEMSDFLRIQLLVFLPGLPEIRKAANMLFLKQAEKLKFSLYWSRDVRGRQGKKEYR